MIISETIAKFPDFLAALFLCHLLYVLLLILL